MTATSENSSDYSGGIAGRNYGTIENCYNTGDVTESNISGGIAGYNYGTITDCYNTGTVNLSGISGGIAGANSSWGEKFVGKITNCYNTGDVTGNIGSGGIAGKNEDVTITNCYNTGVVTANSTNYYAHSGGIAGYNNQGTITNCHNTGVVTANSTNYDAFSGGVAGHNDQGTITNCYNTGTVKAESTNDKAYSGGIAGHNDQGTITNCHNTGVVTGTVTVTSTDDSENYYAYSGGIAGFNSGKITNCYNSGTVKAESTNDKAYSGGIVGKNNVGSTVQYCYSKQNSNQELIGDGSDIPDTCKTFDYDGKFSDNSGSLLKALNEWVKKNNGEDLDKYRYWMDPFIKNDKYPVFTDWYGEAERLHEESPDDSKYKLPEKNDKGVYEIKNGYQLALIADDLNGNYVLSGDINLSGYEWRPIGNSANKFSGTFDGRGHTISNLSVKITSDSVKVYSGLFGYLDSGATVKNLGIINSVIFTNTTYIVDDRAFSGGIAGYNTGTIMNCYNTGTVIGSGTVTFGGIVGENKDGTVSNCYNTGIVIGTETSGGIVGYNSGTVTNCYNTGVVIADTASGDAYSGGIVGYNSGTVTNCYNTGFVAADSTSDANSGGIAGKNDKGKIENCYNTGTVTATTATDGYAYSGGIAGENAGTIENCYNTGTVTANSTNGNVYSGGIAGNNPEGKIKNTFYQSAGDKLLGIGYTSKDDESKTKKLTSDEMKGLKLLGGDDSKYNLNKDKDGNDITDSDSKPWSPDIFGVNDGYPILADVPTQLNPKTSANKSPQSAVYIILDDSKNVSKPTQAENYLKPFMLTGGDKVNATVNYVVNPTTNISSYQWYEMKNDGTLEEVKSNGDSSEFDLVHGTYCVKITIDGYSYTSLTRTASNIVTVSFDSNGGSAVNEIEIDYGTTIARPEDPTKTGYEVEGWYSDEALQTSYIFNTPVTKDIKLYAKWKLIEYSVEYNGNNNTSGTVPTDNKEYTIGKTINVELNEGNLAKSGHIFRGWNYTKDASSALSSPITLDENVIEKYIGEDNILTLYAVWTPIPEPIYTLCLNSNDSTLQTKRYSGTYGTEITLKSASEFGWNESCKFIEWNSKSDGSGISYKEGDKFSLGSETWNLYAIWSDSSYHTVSFDSNGGSNVPSQSIQDGYRASEPTDPVKQGHSFKHWSLNGTKYDFNQSVKEDITLKAEYEVISYKVTFYYNGDVYYSTQVDYNTSLGDRMPSLPSDKDSWNTSENGKGNNFTSDSLITSDTSVYAVSENSITSILIIGGSAAAILAAIAAWMFMRSRYN